MSNNTTFLTDKLYQYLQTNSLRELPILEELQSVTAKLPTSNMQIAPEQGQFMALLMRLMHARKTLEIGVYTGYSSLSVALALPEDGKIIACDINEEWTQIAREFWQKAGVSHKIELYLGPATTTLDKLIVDGEAESFDFAFIDADKAQYETYYEKSLILLRKGGLIAIDNVLWDGEVANSENHEQGTEAIRKINTKLLHDKRVDISMVPIGDGLTLALKK